MKHFVFLLVLLACLPSCSIQKMRYSRGFNLHMEFFGSSGDSENTKAKKKAKVRVLKRYTTETHLMDIARTVRYKLPAEFNNTQVSSDAAGSSTKTPDLTVPASLSALYASIESQHIAQCGNERKRPAGYSENEALSLAVPYHGEISFRKAPLKSPGYTIWIFNTKAILSLMLTFFALACLIIAIFVNAAWFIPAVLFLIASIDQGIKAFYEISDGIGRGKIFLFVSLIYILFWIAGMGIYLIALRNI